MVGQRGAFERLWPFCLATIKCPGESDLINVPLPHLLCMLAYPYNSKRRICRHIDGKPVDFNDMIIVIVKCINYNWMNGSESD